MIIHQNFEKGKRFLSAKLTVMGMDKGQIDDAVNNKLVPLTTDEFQKLKRMNRRERRKWAKKNKRAYPNQMSINLASRGYVNEEK